MKVLVTGGAGYVGSHAARELRRCGHEVTIYDNLSTGYRFLADGFPLIAGGIGDPAPLTPALRGMDAVIHFAGVISVGESVENPRKYFHHNVECALTLLNAAMDAGVRRFVFSSSAAVYGNPARVPIGEDAPRHPINPYGVTKLLFERALEAYGQAYALRFVALRYFNAAGAHPNGDIGELHEPESHLIPLALSAAAGERPHIDVYGNDYPTPDGTCIRDYIHVDDLAEAHVRALDHLAAGGESGALNLGTGQGYSVNEVLDQVETVTGARLSRRVVARRAGDPPVLVADPARAHAVLGWKASRNLEQIVSSAWNWMRKGRQRHAPNTEAAGKESPLRR